MEVCKTAFRPRDNQPQLCSEQHPVESSYKDAAPLCSLTTVTTDIHKKPSTNIFQLQKLQNLCFEGLTLTQHGTELQCDQPT